MDKSSIVSVILLAYKNQKHIFETIKSILAQDYPSIDLIISDDASGIFNAGEVAAYVEKNKGNNISRVLIRQNSENIGTVAHMNLTAGMAEGKYIKFISCGDKFFDRSALTRLYGFMEQQDNSVVTSMSAFCSEDFNNIFYYFPSRRRVDLLNNTMGKELFILLTFSNIISALGCLFQESFFRTEGGFDESYRLLEDYPTWLRISREGGRIPCLDEVCMYYAIGGSSSKSGTAFEAEDLRPDMILCFEKEILPYINESPYFRRHFILYQYLKLKQYDCYSPAEKLGFHIRFLPFAGYRKGKALIKSLIIKVRMSK